MSRTVQYGRVDLNLLRTFVAIYESRSLTGAAQRLFITQPAVSQSLARLRREVADELFYRSGREMVPTPYATEFYPTVHDSLARIDGAVDAVRGFEPGRSTHRFRMALSELGEMRYLPLIVAGVRAEAPAVAVDVTPLDNDLLLEQLTKGLIDLGITSTALIGDFEPVTLKLEPYMLVVARGHPLAGAEVDLATYLAASHVMVAGDSGRPNIAMALDRIGGGPRPRLTVNHFSTLPPILVASDLVATVPMSVAQEWAATWPLAYTRLPFHVEAASVRLYTRTTYPDAAPLAWFRRAVLEATRDHDAPMDMAEVVGWATPTPLP